MTDFSLYLTAETDRVPSIRTAPAGPGALHVAPARARARALPFPGRGRKAVGNSLTGGRAGRN